MRIPTTAQIRELEAKWISDCGENWGQVLMEIAGRAAAIRSLRIWQERPGSVTVVCGKGNNGGDGLVVARYLKLWGIPVQVVVLERDSKSGEGASSKGSRKSSERGSSVATIERQDLQFSSKEANVNKTILENLEVEITVINSLRETGVDEENEEDHLDPEADSLFLDASLIVDAIFGTGLDREVEGIHRRVIESINRSGKPVLSIDIPSGINSDTGQILGAAVRADETVTFGYLKTGLLNYPGNTLKGDLSIVDIGLPEMPEIQPDINLSTVEIVREMLPMRPVDAHKGTFGHLLTVAGSKGMMGAATVAGLSAMKSGAGLCYLAVPDSMLSEPMALELICHSLPSTESGSMARSSLERLRELVEKVDAVVLGPGVGTDHETVELVCELIKEINCPCIVDADALNALAKKQEDLGRSPERFVLTPHPKELARLMQVSVGDIQKDRIKSAQMASQKYGCTVLLKGAMTVVASPDQTIFINPTGNPGMATAGCGDVLSGIIGGLLAQRVDPFQAAVAGAYLHGRAGDILAEELGEAGILAGDIQRIIPLALRSVKEGERSSLESNLLEESSH